MSSDQKPHKVFALPFEEKAATIVRRFTPGEQVIFTVFFAILAISVFGLLWSVNARLSVEVPTQGGSYAEGVIGAPHLINPIFAVSDSDKDLSALIYSGLLRAKSGGGFENDLAEGYTVSDDELIYTFKLKDDLYWHDGMPISADDVVFTVNIAKSDHQNNILKNPKSAEWEGITIEKTTDREVRFTLSHPYAKFLVNATLGILPKHIWGNIDPTQFAFSIYNAQPIGSGPYKIKSVKHGKKGSEDIVEYYDLSPFKKFALGEPFIKDVRIHFYPNAEQLLYGFTHGKIGGMTTASSELAAETATREDGIHAVRTSALPITFGVFFNQNQSSVLADKNVRKALNVSIDRETVIKNVLNGYATAIDSPVPPGATGYRDMAPSTLSMEEKIEKAKTILEDAGWVYNETSGIREKKVKGDVQTLTFSISTSNVPQLENTADILKTTWGKLGASVEIKIFEIGDLKENVIRPRKYDSLLFGNFIEQSSDLFSFWHSSKRLDPGQNIALYTNITVDKLLEGTRSIANRDEQIEKYEAFEDEIRKDIPAVFIYSPDFMYLVPKKIQGMTLEQITVPSERFLDIYQWYIETNKIWKIFSPSETY
ncbi:MAG: hypothetical protein COZ49_01630 [Candidatus Yonathbacteria bacterium CG_4_10_14_3_um_filter_47_65]|uniref:Solute-binding protein family 5 domain-containing protein n=2 Tax=Parcubacteria group TaxID=1794811 RepID=A0A2M8D5T7_9BACT|nr:MAG: hypothetical protein AUJ44_02215 [Candidatus Nomurabacteria bacterium CG1_02_47_685]PIP03314.1 MAG: hypothetical protein COX54_04170 [Candidatus Yonathbacteria bacterium CG23_combo_of_CG06-09_8_20_14_all_46_18]PIQ32052.1 MAG: hypothetical protein COW61_02565 [Candidatus Yonathbacteria bacterium CG17_big_fil_post_rev_8_21_14_2_50_46_19]PIX56540.1 MAG: hypothetical protein COZ49_01630 [Candidatus Yonathbacteria bacterium CG_4_10_14_3_um_filter_47_65]PIY58044.1 MAG: hypothetical protein CO